MEGFRKPAGQWGLMVLMLFSQVIVHGQAAPKTAAAETSQSVPLIDRELFFNGPEYSHAQISPDGSFISFLKPYKGVNNIWVKRTEESLSKARRLTTSEDALGEYYWSADSKYILFSHNIWDNENYNIYAIDPQDSSDGGSPAVRNLTPMDTSSAILYRASAKNPDLLWVGINKRDKRWFDLYTLEISTGNLKLIKKNTEGADQFVFDWDDNPRLAIKHSLTDSSTEILRIGKDGSTTKIFDCGALDRCPVVGFGADNQQVYLISNKGETQDLAALFTLNPETKSLAMVEQDPLSKVDLEDVLFSSQQRGPVATSYTDDRNRMYWRDTSFQADYALLQKKFPGRTMWFSSSTADEQQWLVTVSADDKLTQIWLFNRGSKLATLQFTGQPGLKPFEAHFTRKEPYSYQSSDQETITGYLSLPKGSAAKNLPVIIYPHAGPWTRDRKEFDPLVQFLNNRGYAVLQMNFRGSRGFGKKWLNAGNRQWGLQMQDDITWGVSDLIGKGIADPRRIAILGDHYGGFAALSGITFTPDVYAAAIDINGPANLQSMFAGIPAFWSGTKKEFFERVGDSATAAGKNKLKRISPVFADSLIRTPLMIVYAQHDPLIRKGDNDQIVVALRDSNRKVEYLSLPDEGYPFSDPMNAAAVFAKVETFLNRWLHGRYQEAQRADLAKRTRDITVDILAVTLGVGMPVNALEEFPAPAADLSAGNYVYNITVELPGRKVPLAMLRSIVGDSANWTVTDKILGQSGDQADEATYQKGNLHPVGRKTLQKSTVTEYTFVGREVTTMTDDKSSSATVEGAYLHDGAGIDLLVARLPLKEGYVAGFYLVGDDGKPKLYQLKVTGKDTINNEPCLKVDLTNAENTAIYTRLWINMSNRMAYRMVVPLASFAGAKMTIELRQQQALPKFLLFLWSITPAHGM